MPRNTMGKKPLTPAEKQRRYREKRKTEGKQDGLALWISGPHADTIAALADIMGISKTQAAGVLLKAGLKEFDLLTLEQSAAIKEVAKAATDDPDNLAALGTARQLLRDTFRARAKLLGVKL